MRKKILLLAAIFVLSASVLAYSPDAARAQEGIVPTPTVMSTVIPSEEASVEPVRVAPPALNPENLATAVPTEATTEVVGTLPVVVEATASPETPPVVEATAPAQPVETEEERAAGAALIESAVNAVIESKATLLDAEGNSVPLGSEAAAEILSSDPWFDAGGGVVVGYSSSGICAANVTECHTSATPIQAAIDDTRSTAKVINVETGVYNEQILIQKSLTLQGAGPAASIISGVGVTDTLGSGALINIFTANAVDVIIKNFGIVTGNDFSGILVQTSNVGSEVTIENNNIQGAGATASGYNAGIYSPGSTSNAGALTIKDNTIHDTWDAAVDVNRFSGPVIVARNTIYDNDYHGIIISTQNNQNISSLISVEGNSINMSDADSYSGIMISSAFSNTGGTMSNVEVKGNLVNNIGTDAAGITLINHSTTGLNGLITGAQIESNILMGHLAATGSTGVRLIGNLADPIVSQNNISNLANGVVVDDGSITPGQYTTGGQVIYNKFYGNDTDIRLNEPQTLAAQMNYYSCLDGTDNCAVFGGTNSPLIDGDPGLINDPDSDNDAIFQITGKYVDNCPAVYNPGQADTDSDGLGDLCDSTPYSATVTPTADDDEEETKATATPVYYGTPGAPAAVTITTDGSKPEEISCKSNTTIVKLANNDKATFAGLCDYEVQMKTKTAAEMIAPLPAIPVGSSFVDAMDLTLTQKTQAVTTLPAGKSYTIAFKTPEGSQDKKFFVMFLDSKTNQWKDIPLATDTTITFPALVNAADTADLREFTTGVSTTTDGFVKFSVNFDGLFVLVSR